MLHVEEKRSGPAAGVELALSLLSVLAGLFAILAADRERQSSQTLLGDFLTAVEAVAVVPLLETLQRVVDLVQGFGLHLHQGELDVFLDVGLGALDRVEHLIELPAPRAFFPNA